jgi:hypothetical protein
MTYLEQQPTSDYWNSGPNTVLCHDLPFPLVSKLTFTDSKLNNNTNLLSIWAEASKFWTCKFNETKHKAEHRLPKVLPQFGDNLPPLALSFLPRLSQNHFNLITGQDQHRFLRISQ